MSRPKGSTLSLTHRQNISKAHKGKKFTEEHLAAIRRCNSDPILRKHRSELAKLRWTNSEFRQKCIKSFRESYRYRLENGSIKQFTSEHRQKIGKASVRRWSNSEFKSRVSCKISKYYSILENRETQKLKPLNNLWTQETRNLVSQNTKRQWQDSIQGPKIRRAIRQLWDSPTHLKKMWKAWSKQPNKAELFLQNLLDKHFPNTWKYVGDGQLIIAGKCPDFANINGRKDLIELFGVYWHQPEEVVLRKRHFKQYGYNCIIIWENELQSEQTLVEKIQGR